MDTILFVPHAPPQFPRPFTCALPPQTVANVVDALRGARIPVDYAAGKFKQGYGEAVPPAHAARAMPWGRVGRGA